MAFWTQLLDDLNTKSTFAQNLSPSREPWIGASLGAAGISLNLVVSQKFARVEVYINRGEQAKNKAAFDYLFERKAIIESAVGTELGWERMDEQVTSRIELSKKGLNVADQADWPAMTSFLVDASLRFFAAFKDPVQQLRRSSFW